MSVDNRSVFTDALETLGTIITEKEKRDAIHLAVEPVIAGEALKPGENVGILHGRAFTARQDLKLIGIVDPFLEQYVCTGQRFWLIIHPRKINSLRHVWSHPDLPDTVDIAPQESTEKEASKQWIRTFLESRDVDPDSHPYDNDYSDAGDTAYECVVREALSRELSDKYVGDKQLGFGFAIYGEIPQEFWEHIEVVSGKKIPEANRATSFRCAC